MLKAFTSGSTEKPLTSVGMREQLFTLLVDDVFRKRKRAMAPMDLRDLEPTTEVVEVELVGRADVEVSVVCEWRGGLGPSSGSLHFRGFLPWPANFRDKIAFIGEARRLLIARYSGEERVELIYSQRVLL
mmetsp:Transcript_83061/g.232776  ORF Transcript_83061/g.232776 Transcript_83061/m.232776 type:complete len:130 (+) Transcript_83061:1556-1945(+)